MHCLRVTGVRTEVRRLPAKRGVQVEDQALEVALMFTEGRCEIGKRRGSSR